MNCELHEMESIDTAAIVATPSVPLIQSVETDRASHFRTHHRLLRYAEAHSIEDFIYCRRWAEQQGLPMLILGNGSNVLFTRKQIRSLVVRNRLPRTIREIDDRTIQVSSTVGIAQVLKWCRDRNLESCYYLASVPATIGGAIAMNAGRGRKHNRSIFDYVCSVTYLEGDEVRTLIRSEVPVSYRQTPFTGLTSRLILSVELSFPPGGNESDAARERVAWSRDHQDHDAANCGSVFKESHWRIMRMLQGLRFGSAQYSPRTANWLLSRGPSSKPVVRLIQMAQLLHRLAGRRAVVELIQVE